MYRSLRHGLLPNVYTGYRRVSETVAIRETMAKAWGVEKLPQKTASWSRK